jgi:triacylglycerol lipase
MPKLTTPFLAALLCIGCSAPDVERVGQSQDALTPADTPIFITHGLAAWPFDASLRAHLESLGYTVFMPKVSPFGPVRHRAEELRAQIDASLDEVGAAEGVVIAHSMGGVDARWLVSPDGLDYDRVPVVVTIASPHRGTAIADAVIDGVPFFLRKRVDRLLKALDLAPEDAAELEALSDLTSSKMATFNEQVRDDPQVEYYSYSSEQKPTGGLNPLLYVSYFIIKSKDGANDGIASVKGAKWGHYLGHRNADHADHVGGLGLKTKFDFRGLYREAIELSFGHHNAGSYTPTFSAAPPPPPAFPESEHAYWNNLDSTESHQLPGADALAVSFDALTEVEEGYDFVHVSDAAGAPVGNSPFTGKQLAGVTLSVPGDTVQIRLQTDFTVTRWGYRVTQVEASP